MSLAFEVAGMPVQWEGEGLGEKGLHASTGEVLVEASPECFRPTEVDLLKGDASTARELLNFQPTAGFEELVEMMVKRDIERLA